jgi:carbon-monoxide dehydrogenase iron sulfur subunit
LRVNPKACTGCEACSIICALSHEHRLGINRARVRVEKSLPDLEPPVFKPVFCRMCQSAPCIDVCHTGALSQAEGSGLVFLDVELCTGCGLCVDACPFEAIWVDDQLGVALKCDLCSGKPLCAQYCAPQALSFD